jgi:hypothetical protein
VTGSLPDARFDVHQNWTMALDRAPYRDIWLFEFTAKKLALKSESRQLPWPFTFCFCGYAWTDFSLTSVHARIGNTQRILIKVNWH